MPDLVVYLPEVTVWNRLMMLAHHRSILVFDICYLIGKLFFIGL